MPRLEPDAWETVRLDYEAGLGIRELAKKYNVDKVTIQRRAKKWRRDPKSEIEVRVVKKVVEKEAAKRRATAAANVPTHVPTDVPGGMGAMQNVPTNVPTLPPDAPVTKEEAAEAEAERRATVATRHRDEWEDFEAVKQEAEDVFFDPPMITRVVQTGDKTYTYDIPDFSKIDAAKRLAEVILIRQKGERAAFQLDKNVNTDKVVEAEERDRIIRDTFSMLRDAAKRAVEKQKEAEQQVIIDITPEGTA